MANHDKSGTNLASSVIVAALLATDTYFFRREPPVEMIANIEEVGFFRQEAVGFVNGGVWLILALFIPALCLLSVLMRSKKTVELNESILKKFHLAKSVYYQQCPEIVYAGIWRKAWFPILIISLLCIYYATIFVFIGNVVGHNFLFQHDQSLEVMCFAYLGWYVWTVSTFFTRIVTLELVAATFWNVLIRLVIAGFVALIIHVSGLFEQLKMSADAIGFGVGLFPDSALQWLKDKLRYLLLGTRAGTEDLPLDLIQGVSSFRKLRLFELGLDNCQNLASVNAIELYFASNLKLIEVMDWIAQAQLATLLGKKNFKILQGKGYRNAFDFYRVASSDPKVLASLLKFTEEHLKNLAHGMKESPSYKRLTNLRNIVLNEDSILDSVRLSVVAKTAVLPIGRSGWKTHAGLAGAVTALALLITNVGTLHEAWCKNIGTFCSPPPESTDWAKIVYVSSEGILASTVADAYLAARHSGASVKDSRHDSKISASWPDAWRLIRPATFPQFFLEKRSPRNTKPA